MSNATSESNRHSKLCATCGEPIAFSARKCIHCDAYQDWRRYLAFSSTVLALLVALLSVATVAVPVLRDVLIAKDSDLVGSFQGLSDNGAVFVVSNAGNRPGTVGEAFVIIALRDPPPTNTLPFIMISGLPLEDSYVAETSFVDAGKSKLIKYRPLSSPPKSGPQGPQYPWEETDAGKFQCAMGIDLINFSGRITRNCFEYSCPRVFSVLFSSSQSVASDQETITDKRQETISDRALRSICRPMGQHVEFKAN
jgi:hypothetical protein